MIPLMLAPMAAQAAGRIATTAMDAIPNALAQKKLKGEIDRGQGITGAERSSMGNAAMQPVREMAGGVASEQARAQSASAAGGVGGGSAAQGIRAAQQEAVARAANRTGLGLGAANQAGLDAKRDELAKRQALASEQRNTLLSGILGDAAGIQAMRGQQAGAVPGTFSGDRAAMGAATTPPQLANPRQAAPAMMPTDAQLGTTFDNNPQANIREAGAAFMEQGAKQGPGVSPGMPADFFQKGTGQMYAAQVDASLPPELRARFASMTAQGIDPFVAFKQLTGQEWAPNIPGSAQAINFAPQQRVTVGG